jgi:hypothetical protein
MAVNCFNVPAFDIEILESDARGTGVAGNGDGRVKVGAGVGVERIGEKGVGELGTRTGSVCSSVETTEVAVSLFNPGARLQAANSITNRRMYQRFHPCLTASRPTA